MCFVRSCRWLEVFKSFFQQQLETMSALPVTHWEPFIVGTTFELSAQPPLVVRTLSLWWLRSEDLYLACTVPPSESSHGRLQHTSAHFSTTAADSCACASLPGWQLRAWGLPIQSQRSHSLCGSSSPLRIAVRYSVNSEHEGSLYPLAACACAALQATADGHEPRNLARVVVYSVHAHSL